MENCVVRLPGGEFDEMITDGHGSFATPDKTSSFHIPFEECNLSSLDEVALGDHSSGKYSMEVKSEYFSTCVEKMQSRSQFSSAVEHEIEHSRVHWSEVSGLSDFSEGNNYEEVNRENDKVFRELMSDPRWEHHDFGKFFRIPRMSRLKLGQKIVEGGQTKIFEVIDMDGNVNPDFLLKVFKRGSRLSDIRKQWPCGVPQNEIVCIVRMGIILDNGRFAFLMWKCWGDLRKLIDQAMQEKNNKSSPFLYEWSVEIVQSNSLFEPFKDLYIIENKIGFSHLALLSFNSYPIPIKHTKFQFEKNKFHFG